MYFKDFPQFLYDFNYGDKVKTTVVVDVTRNVRLKKNIFANVTLYDEYDIVDGETPEIISEKFYGTPEYHWIIMLANEKYDHRKDFPLIEPVLQKHIATTYNPVLSSSDWYWDIHDDGLLYFHIRITSVQVPFELAYLTAPVKITVRDDDSSFVKVIDFPTDPIGLDEATQYFYFPVDISYRSWMVSHSKVTSYDSNNQPNGGTGTSTLIVTTEGRENNPVFYVDNNGNRVNPSETATPVTGDVIHRMENDKKRRLKIIAPSLIESILRNYEDELS